MAGLLICFNHLNRHSRVHFHGCKHTRGARTNRYTLWVRNVPVAAAREWVLYGDLPTSYEKRVTKKFKAGTDHYWPHTRACAHCRPL